ncbi:MAG TPA: hypothetical protein VFL83_19000 [Anaeromyxobacter sp.]|nr:hypothetical protein [Anaeromyxobacter sp.]
MATRISWAAAILLGLAALPLPGMERRTVHVEGKLRAALAAALALGLAAAHARAAAPAQDDGRGTYRMQGTARVDAVTPLGREIDSRGDAVVRTAGAGTVRLRLATMGHACELTASRAADGALAFDPGQRCAFELRDPEARGHVEARLRDGRGRLRDRHLSLDLAFDLSGAVALRASGGARVLGMELPSSWTPEIPLNGGAAVRAEGDRDESRAAER